MLRMLDNTISITVCFYTQNSIFMYHKSNIVLIYMHGFKGTEAYTHAHFSAQTLYNNDATLVPKPDYSCIYQLLSLCISLDG